MIRASRNRKATTLLELLIGLSVAVLIVGGALHLLLSAGLSFETNELRVDAGESALRAHAELQADLWRLRSTPGKPPVTLDPTGIAFTASDAAGRAEPIAWRFDAPTGNLTRLVRGKVDRTFGLGKGAAALFRYVAPSYERGQPVALGECGNRVVYTLRLQRVRGDYRNALTLIGAVPLPVKISGNLAPFWGGLPAGVPE